MQRYTGLIVRFAVIAAVVLTFIGFMVSYTVGFNERAVVATFGRAGPESVISEPGLRFRIPYVHSVTKYDTRLRLVESTPETRSTADQRPLVLTAYMTWRVTDPLKFYRRFSGSGDRAEDHYFEAQRILDSKLRSAMTELSNFRFDQLLAVEDGGSRLPEFEDRILKAVTAASRESDTEGALADAGIEAVAVGISSISYPQAVTKSVFDRMNGNRDKIINETISQGASQASAIRSSAETDAKRIIAFAQRLAGALRTKGDAEVAAFTEQMKEKPELAVFLKNMELMRLAHGRTTTLVLPTTMPGMEFFSPGASGLLESGEIPIPGLDRLVAPPARSSRPAAANTEGGDTR